MKLGNVVVSILTLLTLIAVIVLFFVGLSANQIGLSVVCAVLSLGFSLFVYKDVRYYINYFKSK